jgi:hypothetical protein
MKSVIVKYDVPPYILVHNFDPKGSWGGHVSTDVGFFNESAVLGIVDRKVGDKLRLKIDEIKHRWRVDSNAVRDAADEAGKKALKEALK